MKKFIVVFTLLFSLMFSTTSFARWTNIIRDHGGTTFYIDVLRIAKNDRYVYFWELIDYLKPTENGVFSHKVFAQADCKIIKKRIVSFSSYKKPMGAGNGLPYEAKNPKWMQPSPGSAMETMVKSACELAR
jgi:hypothetical protein